MATDVVIPRVTKGSSARGALRYDFGPGRREEHENARTVAGNLPGNWRDQAGALDTHAARRPDVERPVWRSSLRTAPEDRKLSDEEWGRIADRYIDKMGFSKAPWTATRHGDDHIHLTVSRVDWNGRVLSDSHDFARAQAACRVIEREHRLVDASQRYDRSRPQVSHGERERAARTGAEPERDRLRERLDAAVERSQGTLPGYEHALDEAGVVYRRNQASTGRVSGYSYGLRGHTDREGRQVFYKGSQLGKDYRWTETQRRLDQRSQHQQPVPTTSNEDRAQAMARTALERIRGAGDRRLPVQQVGREALAARSPSQENAPRPDTTKGNNMEQTRPGGQTDPGKQPRSQEQGERSTSAQAAMARIREQEAARQERDRDNGRQR